MKAPRYRVNTLPGRITRDCPEVVEAFHYDHLLDLLVEARAAMRRPGGSHPLACCCNVCESVATLCGETAPTDGSSAVQS